MNWQTEIRGWALASAGVFCMSAIGYLAISAGLTVNTTGKHVNATLMSAGDTLDQVKTQLPAIAADVHSTTQAAQGAISDVRKVIPPIANQVNLDLEEGHRVILEAGLTAMEARKASAEERAALPALTLGAEQVIGGFNREIDSLTAFTEHGSVVLGHVDGLVTDPHVTGTIAHTDATMSHVDAITGDAAQMTHKFAHPTKLQVAEGWLETLGVIAAKALVP